MTCARCLSDEPVTGPADPSSKTARLAEAVVAGESKAAESKAAESKGGESKGGEFKCGEFKGGESKGAQFFVGAGARGVFGTSADGDGQGGDGEREVTAVRTLSQRFVRQEELEASQLSSLVLNMARAVCIVQDQAPNGE